VHERTRKNATNDKSAVERHLQTQPVIIVIMLSLSVFGSL